MAVAAVPLALRADAALHGLRRLAHLLGRPVEEGDIRRAAPGEGGFDVRRLALAAERLGFAVRVEPAGRRLLKHLPTPFLLTGRRPGEVWLACGRMNGLLVLADPRTGEAFGLTASEAAAEAAFALRLDPPTAEADAPGDLWRDVIRPRLRPVLWEIGLASAVLNLLALASPLFLMTVYNKVIAHGALATLDVLALGMATLLAFEGVLRVARGHIAAHFGGRLEAAIGAEAFRRFLDLPYRAMAGRSGGEVAERLRSVDALRQFCTGQMPLLLVDLLFVGVFLLALVALAPPLAAVTLVAMPAFFLLSLVVHRRQGRLAEAGFRAAAAKAAALGEAAGNALTVKALGLEAAMARRFELRQAEAAEAGFRAGHLAGLAGAAAQALQAATALAVVYVGARLIVEGRMSVGALVAASLLSARCIAPARQVVAAWHQFRAARDALRVLDAGTTSEAARGLAPPEAGVGRLRVAGLRHRYAPDAPPALDGIDLEVEPGGFLAVIGPPGSGKSTLAKLMLGLETPEAGRVLLDGADVTRLPPAEVRRRVALVPQEIQLFAGTIAENIALGADDATPDRVRAAGRFAGLDAAIARLPNGYATRLGEGGFGLSAGQRQLVCIARALVRNPRVLILDEATSALDAAGEAHVLDNLRRFGRGRTIVLITHRQPAAARADRVAVLRDGRLERCGPPGQVVSLGAARAGRVLDRAVGG